jgi:hypothetical protein
MPTIITRGAISSKGFGLTSGSLWKGLISSNQSNLDLYTYAVANGYPGSGAIQITIAPGVYVYATSTANAGLTIPSSFGAGNLTLINNGYIQGQGGDAGVSPGTVTGGSGGPAMSISTPIILTNNSYIGGGGGAGGGYDGGGGAGGGSGFYNNLFGSTSPVPGAYAGGTASPINGGAGGGGVMPGSPAPGGSPTTTGIATGGSAGGGGYSSQILIRPTPQLYVHSTSGGGGGWGAGGGAGYTYSTPTIVTPAGGAGGGSNNAGAPGFPTPIAYPGGGGGNAINLNGNSITYPATGTIWGTVA